MTILDLKKTQINSAIDLFSKGEIHQTLKVVQDLFKDYPDEPVLFNISGACHAHLGKLEDAIKNYDRAIEIKPDYAKAHFNLAGALQDLGQLESAVNSYEKALAIEPGYAEAHNNLGSVLKDLKQNEAAVQSYKQALVIKPDYIEAQYSLGLTQQDLGQFKAAIKCYEMVIANRPNFADVYNSLGIAFLDFGQFDEAVKSYKAAIKLKPNFLEAINNLGIAFYKLNQLDKAIKFYEQAISLNPDFIDAYNNIGIALFEGGQPNDAIKFYEKVLKIDPNYAEAYNNIGNALKKLLQKNDAVKFYEKAIDLKPNYIDAYANLAAVMLDLNRLDEALIIYESTIIQNSKLEFILGELMHIKMHLCIWDDFPSKLNLLRKKINNSEKVLSPFLLLALIDDPELQRKNAEIYANDLSSISHDLPRIGLYQRHKRIRVAYFSADFRDHPVAHLTSELYELHDRKKFEIYAFSFGPDTKDLMNIRIKAGVDHFYDVRKQSDKDIVMLVRSFEIDIAIDLGGYTADSRTGIFAMSAAPIQASYIGVLSTMGADYYDYLLAGHGMIPKINQKYFSEKIVYLPSYQVNKSKELPPEISLTRKELGLPEEGFIFCCFNNTYKITPTVFDSWARILTNVKESVLFIYVDNESAKTNLSKEIIARGINPRRLIFGGKLPREKYLARYQVADLFLDTRPYNAGTTASDALRMGLPVLTLEGNSFNSREAASIIRALNLPELITTSERDYESVAIELATDPEKLKLIKEALINNLSIASLYDTPLFTKNIESAYTQMYERYLQGLGPNHIYLVQDSLKVLK